MSTDHDHRSDGVVPPASASLGRPGRRRSLDHLTVLGADPVEQTEVAAEAGFDAVGLRFLAPPDLQLEHEVIGNVPLIRSIVRACRSTGIRPLDVEVFFLTPAMDQSRALEGLDAAAEVGASSILAVCGDADRSRALERFVTLCDAAAPAGMDVVLEFMRWSAVPTIGAAVEFVTAAARPNAGICVDALHLDRSGGDPATLPRLPGRGTFVQLSDAPAVRPPVESMLDEARQDRRYPGEGGLPLERLLDALPADTPVSIEVPHRLHAGRSVRERAMLAGRALRSWLDTYEVRPPRPRK